MQMGDSFLLDASNDELPIGAELMNGTDLSDVLGEAALQRSAESTPPRADSAPAALTSTSTDCPSFFGTFNSSAGGVPPPRLARHPSGEP